MTPKEAKTLMGVSDNCTAQINDLGYGCFRVNIFEKITEEGSVVSKNKIVKSGYFVLEGDTYIDRTIKSKETGNIFK